MLTPMDRANTPISLPELERRWAAVRAAMAEHRVDVLLMQNNNDFMGGNVKYFSDLPATNGYPVSIVFPRDDDMTLVQQGPFGHVADAAGSAEARRGIKRVYGTPHYASVFYTDSYDAELVARALAPYAHGRVGLLGRAQLSHALMEHLAGGVLKDATIIDFSGALDAIKAIKSDEELALIRGTAALQDAVMAAVAKSLAPGMRDRDAVGIATAEASRLGSEQGWYMAASGPLGTAAVMQPPHLQNRMMEQGDHFCLLVENSGPGGYYTELGRTFVLGRASQRMHDELAIVLAAQELSHALIRPGASCKDIWDANNDFLRAHDRPQEIRVYAHGQGYDMVERPLLRHDEPMRIASRMNLAVHPNYVAHGTYSWICDNVIVHDDHLEPIHRFPQIITEL